MQNLNKLARKRRSVRGESDAGESLNRLFIAAAVFSRAEKVAGDANLGREKSTPAEVAPSVNKSSRPRCLDSRRI